MTTVRPLPGFDESRVLALAALASSDSGQDAVDAAIRAAAGKSDSGLPKRLAFVPFDPATKMSEAIAVDPSGGKFRVVKGAFAEVAALAQPPPMAAAAAGELESQGFRLLAVAVGPPPALQLAGLIALSDPPRADSAGLVTELRTLGVRTVMVTGDFLGMSLTTDNVRPSPLPNAWRIGRVTIAGIFMGVAELFYCCAVLAIGEFGTRYSIGALRTLAFVAIVFGNQATTYANRERRRLWSSRPSLWLAISSVADILIASTLAISGNFMTPISVVAVAGTLAATVAFAFIVDAAKVPVYGRLGIA